MNLHELEQWLDTEWHGWPRVGWVCIGLAIGIAVLITIGRSL